MNHNPSDLYQGDISNLLSRLNGLKEAPLSQVHLALFIAFQKARQISAKFVHPFSPVWTILKPKHPMFNYRRRFQTFFECPKHVSISKSKQRSLNKWNEEEEKVVFFVLTLLLSLTAKRRQRIDQKPLWFRLLTRWNDVVDRGQEGYTNPSERVVVES